MTRRICVLSTIDNPYNPFDNPVDWRTYDNEMEHYSNEYLARMANTSDGLTDEENDEEVERAIDDILANDLTNMLIKVVKEM